MLMRLKNFVVKENGEYELGICRIRKIGIKV